VIGRIKRTGDKFILTVLRLHDLDRENQLGALPGYKRVHRITGFSLGHIRNRLSAMIRDGVIISERRGRYAHYFIVPPSHVTPESDTSRVIPGSDTSPLEVTRSMSSPEVTGTDRHVTDMSPPGVQSKGKPPPTPPVPCSASPKRSNSGKENRSRWIRPYATAWKARMRGDPNFGQLAREMWALENEHGAQKVLAHWEAYLTGTETPDRVKSVSHFRQRFGLYAPPQTKPGEHHWGDGDMIVRDDAELHDD